MRVPMQALVCVLAGVLPAFADPPKPKEPRVNVAVGPSAVARASRGICTASVYSVGAAVVTRTT